MKQNTSLPVILVVSALAILSGGCASARLRQSTSELPAPAAREEGLVSPKASPSNAAPVYPIAMRRTGTTGMVNVECMIDQSGRVYGATIADTTNHAFSAPTLAAVNQWTFTPGTRHGVPSAMVVILPVEFNLAP